MVNLSERENGVWESKRGDCGNSEYRLSSRNMNIKKSPKIIERGFGHRLA